MRWCILAATFILLGACLGGGTATAPTLPVLTITPLPQPAREPGYLPQFTEELPVLAALERSGMRVELIGGSKFEGMLGSMHRARVFIGTIGDERVGADVLFLDAPVVDVRVCSSSGSAPGFTKFTITVNGAPGSSGEGSQAMYFATGDRFFVMTSDARLRNALFKELGLQVPPC